ncbi:MAG TPA: hypothetical protein VM260_11655 [Pirellula sp.]|nr:hypothetical protein [Pirellula sp.]
MKAMTCLAIVFTTAQVLPIPCGLLAQAPKETPLPNKPNHLESLPEFLPSLLKPNEQDDEIQKLQREQLA